MNENQKINSERERIRTSMASDDNTSMGLRLIRAYERIPSAANRLKVIELAEDFASAKDRN